LLMDALILDRLFALAALPLNPGVPQQRFQTS